MAQFQDAATLGIRKALLSAYETGRCNKPEKILQGLKAFLNLAAPEAVEPF